MRQTPFHSTVGGAKVYVQTTGVGRPRRRARRAKSSGPIPCGTGRHPHPDRPQRIGFVDVGYNVGVLAASARCRLATLSRSGTTGWRPPLTTSTAALSRRRFHRWRQRTTAASPIAKLMTGNVLWSSRGSGKQSASVTAAEGNLYIRYGPSGTMSGSRPNPMPTAGSRSFKIPKSGSRPGGPDPVVADGKLFLRRAAFHSFVTTSSKSNLTTRVSRYRTGGSGPLK